MPDFKLLLQVFCNHLFILLPMLLMGFIFMGLAGLMFWLTQGWGMMVIAGFFFTVGAFVFYMAVTTNYSSCQYYYERALLKKYGVKAQGILTGKVDDSDQERGEFLYLLFYTYDWQGKTYEGEEVVESKAIFDALESGAEIPIIVLSNKPASSVIQLRQLKWLYQVSYKKGKGTVESQGDEDNFNL